MSRPSTGLRSATPVAPVPQASSDPDHTTDADGRGAWRLVAVREVLVRATDKTFLIGTFSTIALLAVALGLQAFLAGRTQTYTVAATPSAQAMASAVASASPGLDDAVVVQVVPVADDATARADVDAGAAEAWLHQQGADWVLTTRSQAHSDLEAVVRQVVASESLRTNAAAAGVTVEELQRGSTLTTAFLRGDAERAQLAEGVGFVIALLSYMSTLLFGYSLAGSVLEEKQSRIVEIIATAVPLRQLLAGKVVGNLLLALAQQVLFLTVGLIGLSFTSFSTLVPGLSASLAWFVAFFVAGFVLLGCLWAVAGALAGRSEDLQATSAPLTTMSIIVFFSAITLQGQWQTILSFVPPWSPVVMPIRLVAGSATWWEALIALGILVASAVVTIRVAAHLYRRSLLQTGGRVGLRQAWRAEL